MCRARLTFSGKRKAKKEIISVEKKGGKKFKTENTKRSKINFW